MIPILVQEAEESVTRPSQKSGRTNLWPFLLFLGKLMLTIKVIDPAFFKPEPCCSLQSTKTIISQLNKSAVRPCFHLKMRMQIFTGISYPIKLGPALTFDLVTTLLLCLILYSFY